MSLLRRQCRNIQATKNYDAVRLSNPTQSLPFLPDALENWHREAKCGLYLRRAEQKVETIRTHNPLKPNPPDGPEIGYDFYPGALLKVNQI